MKKSLLVVGIIAMVGCKNDAGKEGAKSTKRDTAITLAVYLGYQLKGVTWGAARRVTFDSLVWVGKDSTTMKKEWSRFTEYDVEVDIPVKDSLTAKVFGINNTDTIIRRILKADQRYVRDTIINLDSAVASLKKYMVLPDTTKGKPKQ